MANSCQLRCSIAVIILRFDTGTGSLHTAGRERQRRAGGFLSHDTGLYAAAAPLAARIRGADRGISSPTGGRMAADGDDSPRTGVVSSSGSAPPGEPPPGHPDRKARPARPVGRTWWVMPICSARPSAISADSCVQIRPIWPPATSELAFQANRIAARTRRRTSTHGNCISRGKNGANCALLRALLKGYTAECAARTILA
jgi:hypothetical protein